MVYPKRLSLTTNSIHLLSQKTSIVYCCTLYPSFYSSTGNAILFCETSWW